MIPSTGGRSQAHSMKLMGLLSFATEILNDQVKLVFLMETLIKSLILLKLRHRYIKMKRTLLLKLSIEFCVKPIFPVKCIWVKHRREECKKVNKRRVKEGSFQVPKNGISSAENFYIKHLGPCENSKNGK